MLGFTKGFDFIFGKFDLAPGQDLETVLQGCNVAVQADLRIDYCTFKKVKVDGVSQYVNCEDGRIVSQIQGTNTMTCVAPYLPSDYCTRTLRGAVNPSDIDSCAAGTKGTLINFNTVCCA